jgi:hypothetical protein
MARTMLAEPAPGMPGGPQLPLMPPQMAQPQMPGPPQLPPGFGAPPAAAAPVLAAREAFPPVATPTAFRPRAEIINDGGGYPSGDMALLASERAYQQDMPMWILVAAFVVSIGIGTGITVLIGRWSAERATRAQTPRGLAGSQTALVITTCAARSTASCPLR